MIQVLNKYYGFMHPSQGHCRLREGEREEG